jgi:hypothetical protein
MGGTDRTRRGCPAALPPSSGDPLYHLRVDEQVVLVAEHGLSGPLSDLVTAVLAIGAAVP